MPTTSCATTNASPVSASAITSLPLAFNAEAALPSLTAAVAELTVAVSLVPVMVTVIEAGVPSAACTVKVSMAFAPAANWSCAEAAV